MSSFYNLKTSWNSDAKSRTQDYTFTGYVTGLQGVLTLGNSNAGNASTQNVYLYLFVNGAHQEVFYETKSRTARGSCTYNVDIEFNEPLYVTGARFYYTATDNECQVSVDINALGGNYIIDALSDPIQGGTVSGMGYYADGDEVILQASPNEGYVFKNWILKGYTKLNYIESTGTQYIDTGVAYPSGKLLKIDIDLSSTDVPSGTYKTALGMYTASSNGTPFSIWTYSGYGTTKFRDPVNNTDYAFTFDGSRQNIVFQNFSRTGTANSLFLFKANPKGGNTYSGLSEMKIYSCKVSIDSEIIRDYIPVIRHSDIQVGLLDLVEMKFYNNKGTGTFIGGGVYAS